MNKGVGTGYLYAGGELKATGHEFWNEPNTYATNLSGFNALASGTRSLGYVGTFLNKGYNAIFWTSTPHDEVPAYFITLSYNSGEVGSGSHYKNYGHSVRCICEK